MTKIKKIVAEKYPNGNIKKVHFEKGGIPCSSEEGISCILYYEDGTLKEKHVSVDNKHFHRYYYNPGGKLIEERVTLGSVLHRTNGPALILYMYDSNGNLVRKAEESYRFGKKTA